MKITNNADYSRQERIKKLAIHLKERRDALAAAGNTDAARFLDERIAELKDKNPHAARLENKVKAMRQKGNEPLAIRFATKASALRDRDARKDSRKPQE